VKREKDIPASGPFGLLLFQGWKTIFSTLGIYSAKENNKQIFQKAIKLDFITFDKNTQKGRWRVPKSNKKEVIQKITAEFVKCLTLSKTKKISELLSALGNWNYHGSGIESDDLLSILVLSYKNNKLNLLKKILEKYLKGQIYSKDVEHSEYEKAFQEKLRKILKWDRTNSKFIDDLLDYGGMKWELSQHPKISFAYQMLLSIDSKWAIKIAAESCDGQMASLIIENLNWSTNSLQKNKIVGALLKSETLWHNILGIQSLWFEASKNLSESTILDTLGKLKKYKISQEDRLIAIGYWLSELIKNKKDEEYIKILSDTLITTWAEKTLSAETFNNIINILSGRLPDDNNDFLYTLAIKLNKKSSEEAIRIWNLLIKRILKRLPLKDKKTNENHREHFYELRDFPLTKVAALAVFELYDNKSVDWYINNVLSKLKTRDLKIPFLRDKNYNKWFELCEALVW